MNSLEALDELSLMINREKHINSELNKKINDLKQTIKQDLERLEVLEKENKEYFEIISKQAYLLNNKHIDKPIIEKLIQENEKLKNAIEIIKNYYKFKLFPPAMDNIPEISISTDWEHYISQQEYDLLEEVLCE